MDQQILRPGLLVSLRTSLQGGITYHRTDLEREHTEAETGAKVARWETSRRVDDPTEYERGQIARNAARAAVSGVCSSSAFGLLCPESRAADLEAAIAKARAIADAFNAGASLSRVAVYVIAGKIAQNDAEAARAIASEMRDLLTAMEAGIKAADPAAIREAANRARSLGQMLTPETAGRVERAIDQARKAARDIVRRVEKAGEQAATVINSLKTDDLAAARFAFLDLEETQQTAAELTAIPGRAVDFEPEADDPRQDEPDTPPTASDDEPRRAQALTLPFSLEL